jgi:hypothetical protein
LKVPRQCPLVLLVEAAHLIGIRFYLFNITPEGLHYCENWTDIGRATLGWNFDVTSGRAACEARRQRGILCTNSAFAPGSRKTTENLDRVGRSQDLPDANWLLASSPALNTRTLTLVPICVFLLYLKKKFTFFYIFFSYLLILWMCSKQHICGGIRLGVHLIKA